MQNKLRILVLGGNGFIGRHAVTALIKNGAEVTVGSRHASPVKDVTHAQLQVRLQNLLSAQDWLEIVQPFDVVLNSVGILRQRPGESYEAVHHLAPAAVAEACAATQTRFIHVSALGLHAQARSRFLTSKVAGEQAIMATAGDWFIARLSLLDGEGGYGASWLRAVARLPFFVVPSSAIGRIAALTATDAGEALARLALEDSGVLTEPHLADNSGRIFELGGCADFSFEEYVKGLSMRDADKPTSTSAVNPARAVHVPGVVARLFAHIFDVLHFSPFSFGHWELLCSDNVPEPNRLPELLGREPQAVI